MSACSIRTADKAVKQLEQAGFLTVSRSDGRTSNRYQLTLPTLHADAGYPPHEGAGSSVANPAPDDVQPRTGMPSTPHRGAPESEVKANDDVDNYDEEFEDAMALLPGPMPRAQRSEWRQAWKESAAGVRWVIASVAPARSPIGAGTKLIRDGAHRSATAHANDTPNDVTPYGRLASLLRNIGHTFPDWRDFESEIADAERRSGETLSFEESQMLFEAWQEIHEEGQ